MKKPLPLLIKILIAVHFPAVVMAVSYYSPSSMFRNSLSAEEQATEIRRGYNVQPRATERHLIEAFLQTMPRPASVMAWGSSRALAIDSKAVGTTSFLNVSSSNGTLFDLAALYSILRRYKAFPERMIISLDPWMLNADVQVRAWSDYGSNVLRGLRLVGQLDRFRPEVSGLSLRMRLDWDKAAYLTSPAVFQYNFFSTLSSLIHKGRLDWSRTKADLQPIVPGADGWAGDLSYTYPCVAPHVVRARAEAWGTDQANPGELLLEGNFPGLDENRIILLQRLLSAFLKQDVQLFLFLPPFHPATYADMDLSQSRRMDMAAQAEFRRIGKELNIPVFGNYDPAEVGLSEQDFCTDALHIRPPVMRRVFEATGLARALAEQ